MAILLWFVLFPNVSNALSSSLRRTVVSNHNRVTHTATTRGMIVGWSSSSVLPSSRTDSSGVTTYYSVPPTRSFVEEERRASSDNAAATTTTTRHMVDGMECTEVTLNLPFIRNVTILEATAKSQDVLVEMALEDVDTDDFIFYNRHWKHSLTSGDPYGAVLWPSAMAIAKYILINDSIKDLTVLEIGAGTGLVSIAASLGGSRHVIATDYEYIPLTLLRYAATTLNGIRCVDNNNTNNNNAPTTKTAEEESTALDTTCSHNNNDNSSIITTQLFDLRNFTQVLPSADIVLAADILYEPLTGEAMAHRVVEALRRGSRVILGDSPGRPGRVPFLKELKRLAPEIQAEFVNTIGQTCVGERHDLICGKGTQSIDQEARPVNVDILDLRPVENRKY